MSTPKLIFLPIASQLNNIMRTVLLIAWKIFLTRKKNLVLLSVIILRSTNLFLKKNFDKAKQSTVRVVGHDMRYILLDRKKGNISPCWLGKITV